MMYAASRACLIIGDMPNSTEFFARQGKFLQASISCNDPIEGSCTMILHGRLMRPLQNLTDGKKI